MIAWNPAVLFMFYTYLKYLKMNSIHIYVSGSYQDLLISI